MSDNNDDGSAGPRHRKPGRAKKRRNGDQGRHLNLVPPITDASATDESSGRVESCDCPPGYHEYRAHAPGHSTYDEDRPPVPGAYPIEDLASMSSSAVAMMLHRADSEAISETPRVPHIVITRDLETEVVSYTGPFGSGPEALTVAQRFVEQNRAVDPKWRFTLTVAPLFPH